MSMAVTRATRFFKTNPQEADKGKGKGKDKG
jgi:hypothetical protein